MDAFLSGRAAVAIVNDCDQWWSISYDEPDRRIPRKQCEAVLLLRGESDVRTLHDTSVSEVRKNLEDAVDEIEAFDLVLMLLDEQFGEQTHVAAARELEELLIYPEIVESVEKIVFAMPLPAGVNCRRAVRLAIQAQCHSVSTFLAQLQLRQPAVTAVSNAWQSVRPERFQGPEDRDRVKGLFVRHGVFRDLVNDTGENWNVPRINSDVAKYSALSQQISDLDGIDDDLTAALAANQSAFSAASRHAIAFQGHPTFPAHSGPPAMPPRELSPVWQYIEANLQAIRDARQSQEFPKVAEALGVALFPWFVGKWRFQQGDAEELAWETIERSFLKIDRFEWRGQGSFRAWCYKLAANVAVDAKRSQKRFNATLVDGQQLARLAGEAGSDLLLDADPDEPVQLAFAKLSENEREILDLQLTRGMSHQEIGELLGIPTDTARQKAKRAKDKMKRFLTPMDSAENK